MVRKRTEEVDENVKKVDVEKWWKECGEEMDVEESWREKVMRWMLKSGEGKGGGGC